MRLPASEKLEIIGLVELSANPAIAIGLKLIDPVAGEVREDRIIVVAVGRGHKPPPALGLVAARAVSPASRRLPASRNSFDQE